MDNALLLFAAGFIAGTMNAAAGGGSFVTFPALVAAGVPSLAANASSSVALIPGGFASAFAYRRDLAPFPGISLIALMALSIAGGTAGAVLLLITPQPTFDRIIPWLLLIGTATFAFGPRLNAWVDRRFRIGAGAMYSGQFLLAIYGGYFGGAVGIMMMAVWSLLGVSNIHQMNAAKTILVNLTNLVAVVWFIGAGIVRWPETLTILFAALIGGYGGARIVRRLPQHRVRAAIIVLTSAMTAVFFCRLWL